jgi:hypothetical protein
MSDPATPDRTRPQAPTPSRAPAGGKADGITSTTTKPADDTRAGASGSRPADSDTSATTITASTPTEPADATTASVGKSTGKSAGTPGEGTPATPAAGAKAADNEKPASAPIGGQKKKWYRRVRVRGPWLTVGGVIVVLVILALVGYLWGLGPMSRLSTERGITPPAKLGGLERITDQEIRKELQLNEKREALIRINNGKQATVEAYGSIDGNRMFVVIALRGKVDIDKTVADSGATPDKIKKVGHSTCVESTNNLLPQCYRGSNTLTVIVQSANEGVTVDAVEPVAEEAFNAMK